MSEMSRNRPVPVCAGAGLERSATNIQGNKARNGRERVVYIRVYSPNLGDLDPDAVLARAGDGGLDEGHAGDAVDDPGVVEGGRRGLAPACADGPLEGAVQVG